MSRRRHPLPDHLAQRAFTVVEAREAGVPRRVLEGSSLERPWPGMRCHGEPSTVAQKAAVVATILPPGSMFSHATAATILGLPLPQRLERDARIDVLTPTHEPQIRRQGMFGHRGSELRTRVFVEGLPVASAYDVWLDLANELTLDELVVLGDAVIGNDSDRIPDLERLVRRSRGIRGIVKAREALVLMRIGSRSPRETMTRLLLTRGGLPMPELNADVHDEEGGWLANVDFVWREQRVIVEYDGEVHASANQRKKDAQRRRQLVAEGWRVLVLTSADIPARADEVVADIRHLLGR